MEKITLDHTSEFVHLNLNITDERLDEIESEINDEVISGCIKNDIIVVDDAEESISLQGSRIIDVLLNKIAKNQNEQLFLMTQLTTLVDALDRKIKSFGANKGN